MIYRQLTSFQFLDFCSTCIYVVRLLRIVILTIYETIEKRNMSFDHLIQSNNQWQFILSSGRYQNIDNSLPKRLMKFFENNNIPSFELRSQRERER